jgi:predicted nucleotidyltransferase
VNLEDTDVFRTKVKRDIDKIILFGSRARGTHRKDSDTDIMVVTSYFIEEQRGIYEMILRYNRIHGTDVSISLIDKNAWDNPSIESREMKGTIEKEGIIIEDV